MDRKWFILGLLASAAVVSTPRIDSGLEMIAEADAKERVPLSEVEFNRLMAYNTVDDILREYNIGSVDDSSYQRKVYDSDRHVMVLFYNNRCQGSKGLAVLTGLLSREFEGMFEVLGYKMSESSRTTPKDVFEHVTKTYDFKNTPITLIYKNTNGTINKDETLDGAILTFMGFNLGWNASVKYINNNF